VEVLAHQALMGQKMVRQVCSLAWVVALVDRVVAGIQGAMPLEQT
jgi:hypothetical protein